MLDLLTRPPLQGVPVTPPSAVPGQPPSSAAHCGPSGRGRVFTGEWLANGCDCHPYTDGYVGDLVRRWNGWAVFRTSRTVAETIVAHHQNTFTQLMAQHTGRGERTADAWLATLHEFASITWLRDWIIIDSRLLAHDETQVEITTPDTEGGYTIGWSWCWDDVDASTVHTIHGANHR